MKTSLLRTGFLPALALVFSAGCETSFEQLSVPRSWVDARNGIHSVEEDGGMGHKAVFRTVVEFPEDYDWHLDSAFGAVDCTIHLYRDSVELLKFPAGKHRHISPEADTHYIWDSHVYTVYSSAGITYVCKDGDLLFSYDSGIESLRGFAPRPEGVYCLSQTADGLIFRRDGRILERRPEAETLSRLGESPDDQFGALYVDRGELCYAYRKQGVFYLSHGDEVSKLDKPDFLDGVKLVRRIGGNMYFLGVKDGLLAITAPDIPLSASHHGSVAASELYLGSCGGMPYFTATYMNGGRETVDFCTPLLRLFRENCRSVFPMGMREEFTCLMLTDEGVRGQTREAGPFSLEGMRLPSVRCCAYADGVLRLALLQEGRGWLWSSDALMTETVVNGYISCLATED
ncbi:MAG: hypothetical protein IJS07_01715 [Bacteroidales bacterium]|nr:hypothetical protein [Bacteroidales bacterium]